jgi:Xaa-Pro aminopeptidase
VQTFSVPVNALATEEVSLETLLDDAWAAAVRDIADLLGPTTGNQRIALDRPSLRCLMALQQALGHPRKVRVVDSGASIVTRARVIKTSDEVECLRRAQVALERSNMEAVRVLEPGVTSEELNKAMAGFITDLDPNGQVLTIAGKGAAAQVGRVWHVTSAGSRNAAGEPSFPFPPLPSGLFSHGDVIWTDSRVRYHGLEADYGSTWVVGGQPSARLREQRERWCELRDSVAEVLLPGRTAADVLARLMRGRDRAPWLSHVYPMHGIGLGAAEYPVIGADPQGWVIRSLHPWPQLISQPPNEELVLEPGMVLVLEPVIWDESDDHGYRAESTYLITESGTEVLTHDPYPGFESVPGY